MSTLAEILCIFQQGIHMETMRARREFWAEHVQAGQASRLTQVAYCQQHELKPKALAY